MKNLIIWLNRIINKHKALKRWKRVVTVMAAIMTFVTTYALILPAITVERNKTDDIGGMYLEQEAATDDMLEENALEPTGISIAADHEDAVSFSYADEEIEANVIFSTDEDIPEGAELVVYPVDQESEEYADLSSRSAALLDKEFIYDVTTCSFYDFALVYDNVDVTPETGLVDIQINFLNNTVEHVEDTLFAGRFAKPASEEGGFVAMSADDRTIDIVEAADELISVNPDESSVIELTDDIITVFSLKGNDLAYSDSLVGILAGYVDEELKAAVAETDAEIPEYDDSQDEYDLGDSAEADEEEATSAVNFLRVFGSDYNVTLTYDETSGIPEGADLVVSEIDQNSKEYQTYLQETKKAMGLTEEETLPRFAARFFDIKIMVGEDEFKPESGVSIEITYAEPLAEKADAEVSAVHFADETAEAEMIEASQAEVQEDGASTIEFTAESFSVYGVIYIVDFQWEVNGKTYEFSIPGGGFVSLQQLVEVLGIAKPEEVRDFVSEVDSVEFSEPSLVWVGKVSESGTVGWLKEVYGLECQYSAELTEEQIAEINNSVVESGDWALISMLPFETEEMLTVTMKNGVAFTVGVTDDRVDYSGSIVSGNKYYIYTYSANANYAVGYNGSAAQMTDINNPGLGNDYLWTFTNHDGYWLIQNVGHPDTYLDLKNGNVTSTSGTGITIADWYDGTGGFVLSNYNNNNYTWSSLIIDMSVNPRTRFQTVDGLFGSRMRLLDEVTTPTVTPTPAMGNHVTIHYVDRNGNVLTNITKKSTCNSSVVANADGTFSIPYNINGNVDLRADFDFTDVTNATLEIEHAEYTYANSHLDGKDASGKSLKHEGYLIDSRLTSSFSGLQFASDSGETNYSPNNNPPIGNLKYGNLTSTLLSDRITRRTGNSDRPILYASSNNKDIYVILDPLPENTTEALNSTNIDAEAPKLTKDMAPNHDGTYTLSLKVDAHGRNVSETNKANILFVVDTSSSMRNKTQNGSTRIIDTHDAVRSLGRKLLDYNDEHPDAVEVAMLTFDGSVDERLNWTKNKTTFTNAVDEYLRYYYLHTGTDWEDGMRNALNKLLSNSTDDDPTFVIFFTDGEPSQYTNFSGKGENNNTDVPDPITHGTVHESVSGGYPNFYSYFLSREGSKDEMRAVVDTGAMLYGIYAYNTTTEGYTSYNGREDGAAMLHNAIKYGYNTSESLKDNLFYEAKNTDDLKGAFDKIYNLITEKVGFTNVVVKDGIATGVTSSTVVNGDVSGFTYIIRDNNNALAYQVTVAPNGVPDGMTVEDDTPIFTFSEGGTPCIGEKKQVTFTRIIKDGNGNPILDENDEIQTEQATDWVYYYKDADNKEYIMPIATTGTEVKWDLSPLGLLKDGYSYELDFVVWPNQDAYDLVADLNNGLRTDLEASAHWEDKPILKDQDQKEYQIGGFEDYPYISRYVETGVYSAMSNTGQGVDFYKADVKIVNGQEVTEITHPDPDPVDPPGPMPLTATESQIEKQWNVDRNPRVLTELLYGKKDPVTKEWIPFSITFGVFIEDPTGEATDPTDPDNPDDPTNPDNPTDPDNPDDPTDPDNPTDPDAPADETEEEPYKSVTLGWNDAWDKETHDYEWVDTPATDNVEYDGVGHKVGTRWAQDFSIATGIMLDDEHMEARHLNKSLFPSFVYKNKTYYILEEGHDYRLEENPKLSYDFDAPETEFHPMLVNGKLQSVTFSRNEAGKITGIDAMTDEENGISSLKVENTLRGYINLRKVVVGRDGTSLRPTDETKFFYHISLVNPTPVFDGDHIPWYAVNGLYYHDDDFNYYQAYLDEQHNLKICTESGTLDNPYDAEIGTIDPETEEFVPGGTFDENDVTGQAIRFNDGSGARVVIIKGNRTAAAADQHSTEADMWINRNETLSIANVPLGTEYTITETQTDGYQLVSVVSNQSENDKADIRISGYEITGNIIQNANNDVTYTNKVIDGSLQITKNVTVDGQPAVGTDFATWADGEYFFTITDANGKPAVGKVGNNWIGKDGKVRVVIENGVSKTVTVTDMRIGEYTITEDKPNNGTTLVEFKVDGSAKTVENGVVVDDDDKKITVVENETTTTSFTNNINSTSVEVQKVWTDDGQTGVDHTGQTVNYKIYRIPYQMVDDPDHEGQKIRGVSYPAQEVTETLVPNLSANGFTGTLCYNSADQGKSWRETVSKLPRAGKYLPAGEQDRVQVFYEYYVTEETVVEGYRSIIDGGEITEGVRRGDYTYIITNEPLGPTDQETQIDVKKEWKTADGEADSDIHKNDNVLLRVTQKKYEAKVVIGTGDEAVAKMLYPITINLSDKNGNNNNPRVDHTYVVYVPQGASFTMEPHWVENGTNVDNHTVAVHGNGITVTPRSQSPSTITYSNKPYTYYYPGATFAIEAVDSAKEITLELHAGDDKWMDLYDMYHLSEEPSYTDRHQWTCEMTSSDEIIWDLDEMLENVLLGVNGPAHADPVLIYTSDHGYTMKLTDNETGLPTVISNGENSPGHGEGSADHTWEGSITHLPLYEYIDSGNDAGKSFIYTYEVTEAAIESDTVNTAADKPEGWNGQTTDYLVKWNKNTQTGLWTLTNQKKPPIDVTLYKVDKNDIPSSSTRLEGAKFKLVKKKLVHESEHHWVWSKDLDWGTSGESEVVSENPQNPGVFSFDNLDAGYYEIIETKRPAGYIQASENPVFQVQYSRDSVVPEIVLVYASGANIGQPVTGNATDMVSVDNKAIIVGNEHGAALPHTGGHGIALFYLIGILLTGVAVIGIVIQKNRRVT